MAEKRNALIHELANIDPNNYPLTPAPELIAKSITNAIDNASDMDFLGQGGCLVTMIMIKSNICKIFLPGNNLDKYNAGRNWSITCDLGFCHTTTPMVCQWFQCMQQGHFWVASDEMSQSRRPPWLAKKHNPNGDTERIMSKKSIVEVWYDFYMSKIK